MNRQLISLERINVVRETNETKVLTRVAHVNGCELHDPVVYFTCRIYSFHSFEYSCSCIQGQSVGRRGAALSICSVHTRPSRQPCARVTAVVPAVVTSRFCERRSSLCSAPRVNVCVCSSAEYREAFGLTRVFKSVQMKNVRYYFNGCVHSGSALCGFSHEIALLSI